MEEKIKVVWLCCFSNAFVHERLALRQDYLLQVIKRLTHKPVTTDVPEFANWITNGIKEFESINDVELHIVSPYPFLKDIIQEFESNGIYYHFFQDEENTLQTSLYKHIFRPSNYKYRRNRLIVKRIINGIKPDIIHLFGAENPNCSLGILEDFRPAITIVQLQTLLHDPVFLERNQIDRKSYAYRASIEKKIILKADYLATPAKKYRKIIVDRINPNAHFLNLGLPLKEKVEKQDIEKQFDFVYFAANINKAADLAIEAFGLAYQQNHSITMDIVGGYDKTTMRSLDTIMLKYGVKDAITFEGMLPTHDDVLMQIKKSRFALLPLKVDLVSGTIREAMSNGLPVITTDTGELGTQQLNKKRLNVLLSPIGNHQALANNMLRLLIDTELADQLCNNALQTRSEVKTNEEVARKYLEVYKACLSFSRENEQIPPELVEVK